MDILVWQTAKAQLYLLEANYVKKLIGRERILRNKDALRELRCFQEILADVHAGEFGRSPERRQLAKEAADCWHRLLSATTGTPLTPEQALGSFEVSSQIRRLLVGHFQNPGCVRSPTMAAATAGLFTSSSSTRAPSTVTAAHDDAVSAATSDIRSEVGDLVSSAVSSNQQRKRLCPDQLNRLAEELREQIDQEYTSLMASIEEIQTLMEAEVAGEAQLPSVEELEAFISHVNEALSNVMAFEADSRIDLSEHAKQSRREAKEADLSPVIEESSSEDCPRQNASASIVLEALELSERFTSSTVRQRWADMGSDDDIEQAEVLSFCKETETFPPKAATATLAECRRCYQQLPRASFSRRAWREARGLCSDRLRTSAICMDCSKVHEVSQSVTRAKLPVATSRR